MRCDAENFTSSGHLRDENQISSCVKFWFLIFSALIEKIALEWFTSWWCTKQIHKYSRLTTIYSINMCIKNFSSSASFKPTPRILKIQIPVCCQTICYFMRKIIFASRSKPRKTLISAKSAIAQLESALSAAWSKSVSLCAVNQNWNSCKAVSHYHDLWITV